MSGGCLVAVGGGVEGVVVEDLEECGDVAVGDWGDCSGECGGSSDDFEGCLGDVDTAVGAAEGSASAHSVGEDLGEGFGGSGSGCVCRGSGCLHSGKDI